MTRRRTTSTPERRRLAPLLAVALALLVTPVLVGAARAEEPIDDGEVAETEQVDLGAYIGTVRITVPPGAAIDVEADDRTWRLTEDIELTLRGDHLLLVNEIPMGTYLEGIAEVPVRWPSEVLKAQVVAARTYAWRSVRRGVWDGYDICATVACQVFRGREVVEGPGGDRWAAAVAATAGEVLMYDGEPILARYFSTSGGETRPNEEVFPSEGSFPYLRGVDDPEDAVSPLHTWQVRFDRDEMDAILARGEQLGAASPLEELEVVPAGGGRPDQVRVTGRDGTTATVNASTFRGFVSSVAPELFPDRFPAELEGGRRMPETLPSSRISFTVTDDEVVIDGRGFGHGVGMSQYGAYGKALDGMAYDDILAAYYEGLRPTVADAMPDRLRVGLVEDASEVRLRAEGPVEVRAGGELITPRALGRWEVRPGEDRTLRLTGPPGYGAPLVVAETTVAHPTPAEVHTVEIETVVNKTSELAFTVHDRDGREVVRRDLGVIEPGRHTTRWELDDAAGDPLPPSSYEVALRATDETGEEGGAAADVEVRAVEPPADGPRGLHAPPPPGRGQLGPGALGAGILGAVAGLFAARLTEER